MRIVFAAREKVPLARETLIDCSNDSVIGRSV
jgi:hypothetical protein